MIEKTKKYLVRGIPNVKGLPKISYVRYFLFKNEKVELRIQEKDNKYELERITNLTGGETEKTKLSITKEEFDILKTCSIGKIVRDSYTIQEDPEIVIRFYRDEYEGLVRAETEIEDVPEWFGEEITDNVLGRDGRLMKLNRGDFLATLMTFDQK